MKRGTNMRKTHIIYIRRGKDLRGMMALVREGIMEGTGKRGGK
jgi:hypothetical protein